MWISCLSSGLCRAGGGHVLGCGHCGFAYAVLATRPEATERNDHPDMNGTTFAAQRSPAHRDLYGISCADPATCYAVGDNGTILARR